jgi:hypothetical protein
MSCKTVIRVVHNKENPYVMINKEALWDYRISMKAAGLLARAMCKPDNWRFNLSDLMNRCKEGRKALDSAMKELLEFGYAMRIDFWTKDLNGQFMAKQCGTEYIFFEFPSTNEDKEIQLKKFQETYPDRNFRDANSKASPPLPAEMAACKTRDCCFGNGGNRDCCFGDRRFGNPRKEPLLNTEDTEIYKTDISPPIPPQKVEQKEETKQRAAEPMAAEAAEMKISSFQPPPKKPPLIKEISSEATELAEAVISTLIKHDPEYRRPKNMTSVFSEADYMLRLDQWRSEKVIEVLSWALSDGFWRDKMFKPNPTKYLREKYIQLKNKMDAPPPVNPYAVDRRLKDHDGRPIKDPFLDNLF